MDSQQLNPTPQTPAVESAPVKENVLAGAVGAFLFALVGGVLWFVLYLVGFFGEKRRSWGAPSKQRPSKPPWQRWAFPWCRW